MLVAIYPEHHDLPFWHYPKLPSTLFGLYMGEFRVPYPPSPYSKLENEAIWRVLVALHELEIPNLMAHVSLGMHLQRKMVWYPKRIWVQLSTVPEKSIGEIPLTVVDGRPLVTHVWGGDNETRDPAGLVGGRELTKEGWKRFFVARLAEVHIKADSEIANLNDRIAIQVLLRDLTTNLPTVLAD